MNRSPLRLLLSLASLLLVLAPVAASAQGFSALVTPPRFEDRAKAGTVYRNVIEITNVSSQTNRFHLKTNDWTFRPDATVDFSDALAPGSCRPWVGLEASEISIAAGAKRRYRFEVAVPADAPAGQCRFAIMLEGDSSQTGGDVSLPVAGRIAVIVYLTIGDAAANLEVLQAQAKVIERQRVPVLTVRNSGTAHGRLEGFLDGTPSQGRAIAFLPSSFPILPGETREVVLAPQADGPDSAPPVVTFPIQIKGRLEWDGKALPIDVTVTP